MMESPADILTVSVDRSPQLQMLKGTEMRSYGPKPQCPWRKPKKHPLDRADKIANGVIGALFGVFVAAPVSIELAFAILVNERGSLWWTVELEGISVMVFGSLGTIFGDRFINWMTENWHLFFRQHGSG
jgi:hypothetical protein